VNFWSEIWGKNTMAALVWHGRMGQKLMEESRIEKA